MATTTRSLDRLWGKSNLKRFNEWGGASRMAGSRPQIGSGGDFLEACGDHLVPAMKAACPVYLPHPRRRQSPLPKRVARRCKASHARRYDSADAPPSASSLALLRL
uniref:Uncharacterized protein n=1 Tax=Oryza barthii TaxID=65489 RepID=A0A0D3FDA0_9ORYZ